MNYAVGRSPSNRNDSQPAGLSQIYRPIEQHLAAVDQLLQDQIAMASAPIAEKLNATGLASGKRVRPAMLLLAGGCFADLKKPHVAASAALELVHVATLVHDDVLDGADERRHEPSLNALCDNTSAILTGDYLFSKAFEVACASASMETVRLIAQSSCNVCEGEIQQNLSTGNFELSESEYFSIISMKTAQLCKVACGLGGILSECDDSTVERLFQFGEDIGIAFQIIDDVLDIVGTEEQVGKTLGTDLSNKKMTLPMIHCLANTKDDGRRAEMLSQLEQGMAAEQAVEYLSQSGSIEYSREIARKHATNALSFASELGDSLHAVGLRQLAEFVLMRTH